MTADSIDIPEEALDEAARALGDEYEQPADWWRGDARLAIEAALPALYREWANAGETPHLAAYRRNARLITSESVSPRSCALACAARHSPSGTRMVRCGIRVYLSGILRNPVHELAAGLGLADLIPLSEPPDAQRPDVGRGVFPLTQGACALDPVLPIGCFVDPGFDLLELHPDPLSVCTETNTSVHTAQGGPHVS